MSLTIKVDEGKCDCVRHRLKIYNYERTLRSLLERINNSRIDPRNKIKILEFYRECLSQGLSQARIIKYLDTIERIARLLGKLFEDATKDDIAELVQRIEGNNYSEWTKHDYKLILKRFYKWLKKTDDYPEEVKWIQTRIRRNNNLLPEEILTEDEVKKLAEHAKNPRDKAFILVLYESGCRIGEILSLRIRNVQFDEYGAVLIVSGKTGDRRVRIIFSAPKLASWIEHHPLKENPDAPLWVNLSTRNRNSVLTYTSAKSVLKDIAKRTGTKKRIYPHLFRHSRATYLANHLTEAQLKHHFGWVQGSRMAATYVHLSGKEVDNALLKLQGIKVDEDNKESKLKVVACPRCEEKNSPISKFCCRCGSPMDASTAEQIDEYKAKVERLMNELIKNPKILNALLEGIERLKEEATQTNLSFGNQNSLDESKSNKSRT